MDTNNTEIPKDNSVPNVSQTKTETVTTSDVPIGTDSSIGNLSVRAILAIIVTVTLCAMTLFQFKVVEPFYSASLFVLGFFFGQKTNK